MDEYFLPLGRISHNFIGWNHVDSILGLHLAHRVISIVHVLRIFFIRLVHPVKPKHIIIQKFIFNIHKCKYLLKIIITNLSSNRWIYFDDNENIIIMHNSTNFFSSSYHSHNYIYNTHTQVLLCLSSPNSFIYLEKVLKIIC